MKTWINDEISILVDNYACKDMQKLLKINRTEDCIRHKANELNIKHMGWKT